MNLAQTQFNKLAFSDETDLSKAEVIVNVSEGVDESTSFGYEVSYENISIEDNQQTPFKAMHTLTAIGLATSGVNKTNLLDLADPDAKAMIAIIGNDMVLVSLDPVKLEFIDKFDSGNFWRFKATVQSVPYLERTTGRRGAGLHVGSNMLSVYAFTDADSDGVANGTDASDFTSPSFSNGVQTVTVPNTGLIYSYDFPTMFFPFVGETLTLSTQVDVTVDGGHTNRLELRFYDDAGSLISTEASASFSTSGRKSVTATIPANTVEIQAAVVSEDATATGTSELDISEPALRVDGKTVYTVV